MKTKFLFATCAATLLAACTNEEFVSTPGNDLANRAMVDITLGADMGTYTMGDASTRTMWDKGIYYWEAGDMLGACLVDGSGSVAYDNILTNYPFFPVEEITTPVASADFKTNTAVYEGTYVFYHGYQAEMTTAKTLTVNFPTSQEMNAEKPNAHLTADNFFISPLIKIKGGIAYNDANTIPVQFTSLYSGFAPTLKNTSDTEVKVSKVEVYPEGSGTFNVGGKINTVESILGDVVASDVENLKEKIATKVEAMRAGTVDLYASGATTAQMVSITLPDVAIAAGGSQEIRMLFPAGKYSSGLTMKVYTDKGVFTASVTSGEVTFNRDQFRTATYEMNAFQYPSEFSIFNKKDWAYAVKFIKDNAWYTNHAAAFILEDNITLDATTDIPAYSIYVDPKSGKKLILDQKGATFNLSQDSYIGVLEVAKGTTLNLDGKSFINNLTNKGEIKIAKSVAVETKNNVAYATWAGQKIESRDYGISTFVNNGNITIDGELKLGLENPTLAAGSSITNNGTLTIVNNVENNGSIANNGGLFVADGVTLTNSGEINLGANCTVQCKAQTATSIITNNGIITLADVKDVFKDKGGQETDDDLVTNDGAGVTSVAITPSSDLGKLKTISEVNCVTISGDWNATAIEKIDAATSITALLLNGATIDVKGFVSTPGDETLKKVTTITVVDKESTIKNTATGTDAQFAMKATKLTINEGAKLTIAKNVKFGVASTSAVATITVLGKLENWGSVAGDITVGADAAALVPANTSASIVNNEDAKLFAASDIAANNFTINAITNYGTVDNYGSLYTTKVDNKIVGKSIFRGNITSSDSQQATSEF